MQVPSLGGSLKLVFFIDDCSNWVKVFPLARKRDTVLYTLRFVLKAERHTESNPSFFAVMEARSTCPDILSHILTKMVPYPIYLFCMCHSRTALHKE